MIRTKASTMRRTTKPENGNFHYEDYTGLIHSRVLSWHRTTGLDLEDCVSIANLGFAEACDKYKPSKGKFSTYLWNGINLQFRAYFVHNHNKWLPIYTTGDYEELASTNGEAQKFVDKILTLSGRSQRIVTEILENPNEFCYKGTQVTRSNGQLTGKIAKMGYSWRTSRRIISEIKQAFKEE